MNLTLNIDDSLLQQARRVYGEASDRELLERGLRALIQHVTQQASKPSGLKNIGKVSEKLSPVNFEAPDRRAVYHGPTVSLADMDAAILEEAARRK